MKSVIEMIKLQSRGLAIHPLDLLDSNYIKVKPPAECYMRLVIEHIGRGPRGLEMVSVTHYYEQNGDQCTDPEMTFEVVREAWDRAEYWGPVSFEMGAQGIYRRGVYLGDDGRVICDPHEVRDQRAFVKTWDKNIRAQGFIKQFASQLANPS